MDRLVIGLAILGVACGSKTAPAGSSPSSAPSSAPSSTLPREVSTDAPALPVLTAAPLVGPLPTIDDYCAGLPDDTWCAVLESDELDVADRPDQPISALRIVGHGERDALTCALALRTTRGWFVAPALFDACSEGDFLRFDLRVEAMPDRDAEILAVTLQRTWSRRDHDEDAGSFCCVDTRCEELVSLCAIGPSATPSCTWPEGALLAGVDETDASCLAFDWAVDRSLHGERLDLTSSAPPESIDEATRARLGTWKLAFP